MKSVQFLAKVRLPQRRGDILRRSRLVDFLHQHVDKRLILVCAAAGYGKTTLLVDFAHDAGLPVCWYSMDASDSDPRTFFEYLLLSLRQRFPDFGHQTEALLNSIEDVGRDVNALVASLTNEIQSTIPDYFLLVLDDYHAANDSEVVNSALDLLIYYLPDNCHLVVSSRILPLLTYSRLAAQWQVAGLGTTDLRFNPEELSTLLRSNYKLAMPAGQVEKLIEASEGWITGVLLSTHTPWLGLVESLVKAKGSDSPLFDYLADEAFRQQPPEVQRFLLCSAVLDQMTPDMCDRLFAQGTAAEVLRYLVRANLFIGALEGPGEWYRYHNLFQDFLRAKLKAEAPDLHSRLHLRAAEMAEEQGQWDRAFDLYQSAGAAENAAGMVERVGEEMMRSGHWLTLGRWLDSLPPASIDARAKLSLYRGRTYIWSGEPERAVTYLELASRRYQLMGDAEGAGGALTLKAAGLGMKGRVKEAIECCAEALALVGDRPSRTSAEAHRVTGISLAAQGRLAEAEGDLQHALEIYEATEDEAGMAGISQAMGILAVRRGDLARGMAHYRRALASWQRAGSAASMAAVLNCIASVHHYTGEYQEALPILEDALDKARQSGNLRSEAFALGGLGDVRRDSGELQTALESYESALDIAQRIDESSLVNYLLDGLSATHRLLGDYATAERLLRQALQQAEEAQSPLEMASYSVSAGVLAEDQGDLARAEELLRSAVDRLEGSGARRDQARARFHLARTLFAGGDQAGAASELEACLELCRQVGYDQFMVAEGQRAGELVAWAVARGIGGRRMELVGERLRRVRPPVRTGRIPRIRVESVAPKRIDIYSLGETRVVVDSRLVTSGDWAVEKTKEMFFLLLCQPHSLRKEQIADTLWPELDEGKSNSQFHSTLYRLRRALFPQCVAFQEGRYRLTLDDTSRFDAEEFVRLLAEAERRDSKPSQQIDSYQRALSLYKGPFLQEFYSEWVVLRREELEVRYLQALTRLARLKAAEGVLGEAADLLRAAVAIDPLLEDANYGLVLYTALAGDRAAALRHYKNYTKRLRNELGTKPGANITALATRIVRDQPIRLP